MSEENQVENVELESTPAEGASFEAPTDAQEVIAALPTPEQLNEAAAKAAIDASGTVQLSAIYRNKVNNSHAKVANLVAKIMNEAKRAENWQQDEVSAIWDRVEAELAAA